MQGEGSAACALALGRGGGVQGGLVAVDEEGHVGQRRARLHGGHQRRAVAGSLLPDQLVDDAPAQLDVALVGRQEGDGEGDALRRQVHRRGDAFS